MVSNKRVVNGTPNCQGETASEERSNEAVRIQSYEQVEPHIFLKFLKLSIVALLVVEVLTGGTIRTK